MCHYRHRAHGDPFAWPGLTDITAHVDFTAMARGGRARGTRGRGLHGAGAVPARLRHPRRARRDRRARNRRRICAPRRRCRSLLSPAEMGELFKVLALAKSDDIAWPGFAIVDRRHRSVERRGPRTESPWKRRSPPTASSWARCRRVTRAIVRITPPSSSRRAARTSTRSASPGASSTPTSIAARTRSRRSASRAAIAWRRCFPTRSSSSPPTGRARSSAPSSCRCRRCSTATGLASLLADASPARRARLGAISARCWTRCARAAADRAPAWVLVDAAPDDEAAGYRALAPLIADASEARSGRRRRAGRPAGRSCTRPARRALPKGIQHTHFIRAMYATRWRTRGG